MKRRTVLQAASAAASLTGLRMPSAFAQDGFPDRPITLICPYAEGGNSDLRSRQLAQFISIALGQPVNVDNKPGSGGNLGTEIVAKSKPDGYTLGMGNFAPLAVNRHMFARMEFDPIKELAPICVIERGPLVLMVPIASPFKSVRDVILAAKANPGKLTFASGGLGGSHHLCGEMFKSSAGLSITHVPYKGGSLATADLIAGRVDMMFEQMYSAAPSIRIGKLRALAISSRKRSPLFPNLPSMSEAGVPGFEVLNWQGLVAPAGTARAIVLTLNGVVNKALQDPAIREQMRGQGNELGGGSPELFSAFIAAESSRWGKLVRASNIKAE